MEALVILGALLLWFVLFCVCFWGGSAIIDRIYRKQEKKQNIEPEELEAEKKTFRIYVICFFIGIPILSIVALFIK